MFPVHLMWHPHPLHNQQMWGGWSWSILEGTKQELDGTWGEQVPNLLNDLTASSTLLVYICKSSSSTSFRVCWWYVHSSVFIFTIDSVIFSLNGLWECIAWINFSLHALQLKNGQHGAAWVPGDSLSNDACVVTDRTELISTVIILTMASVNLGYMMTGVAAPITSQKALLKEPSKFCWKLTWEEVHIDGYW